MAIDQAPSELPQIVRERGEKAEFELAERGTRKPAVTSISYDHVHVDYREEIVAQTLYHWPLPCDRFREQDTARSSFIVVV